jgi:hypothetical protein
MAWHEADIPTIPCNIRSEIRESLDSWIDGSSVETLRAADYEIKFKLATL